MDNMEKYPFEAYYDEYYPQIYGYILKKIGDPFDAEDLAMDVFVACHQNFESFDHKKATFATWVYVIANNKLKNYYRDKKITEELDDTIESPVVFEDELLAAVYISEMRQDLANALNSLSEVQKTIVIQKFFNNKNANEIAEIVGISPGNVRVQLSRALNKLKEQFADKNIDWEY